MIHLILLYADKKREKLHSKTTSKVFTEQRTLRMHVA